MLSFVTLARLAKGGGGRGGLGTDLGGEGKPYSLDRIVMIVVGLCRISCKFFFRF